LTGISSKAEFQGYLLKITNHYKSTCLKVYGFIKVGKHGEMKRKSPAGISVSIVTTQSHHKQHVRQHSL
jgi:hypothetical protein